MKRAVRLLTATILVGAIAATAAAQEKGLYLGAAGGINLARNSDLESGALTQSADLETGWAALLSIGYAYGSGWRPEFEFSYRSNDVDKVATFPATGDVRVYATMMNMNYDFNLGTFVRPFVGIGLGAAWVDVDGAAPTFGSRISETDLGFAYQVTAGLNFDIADQVKAVAFYRYMGVPSLEYRTAANAAVDAEYNAHSFMVGLRYSFGPPPVMPAPVAQPAPPPPVAQAAPPPPPAAQIPRRYLVFFDFDKATLTDDARAIVRSAAQAARQTGVVRLEVTGHTDRSGSDRYNATLSLRRAEAIKAELVRNGVNEREIAVLSKGESEPLVRTPDGAREPQNRRVEIVFR